MKRMISYLLVTVIMLGVLVGCDTAPKEVEEHTFPDAEYAVNATDMAVVGDKIYYISDEKVYETASDIVVFEEFPAQFLASNGKKLAVYGNGQVWCGEETYIIPQTEITSFVYADGTFCWSYQNDNLPQIGFYNVKSNETISANPLSGVECKVMPYQGTKILVLCYEMDGTMVLHDYDTETMKPGTLLVQDTIHIGAYNRSEDAIAYTSKNSTRLTILKKEGEKAVQCTPCTPMRDGVQKCLFSAGSAVFLTAAGTIYVRKNYTEGEFGNTVTVITNGTTDFYGKKRMTELCDTVFEQYGIEVIIENHTDSAKITQKQLAGDDDYDLYFTNGNDIILRYPVYEPLNEYPEIIEQFDTMLDEVQGLCTYNGDIFGVPTRLDVTNSVWGYNAELLDKLGLSLPDAGWTLEDFYEMAVKVRDQGAYIASYIPLWSGLYISQYGNINTSAGLQEDGTILRDMLEINKKLKTEGLLYDPETAPADAEILFFTDNASLSFITSECDVWYIPTFDGRPVVHSYLAFLHMNVHSLNKPQATQVIAAFMKEQSTDWPTLGWTLYQKTADSLRSVSEKSNENMDIYISLLSSLTPHPYYAEFRIFANEQEQKYYNDEQDLEYTVDQIYARAKMYFEE